MILYGLHTVVLLGCMLTLEMFLTLSLLPGRKAVKKIIKTNSGKMLKAYFIQVSSPYRLGYNLCKIYWNKLNYLLCFMVKYPANLFISLVSLSGK